MMNSRQTDDTSELPNDAAAATDHHERNARSAAPIQALRAEIAKRWESVIPLLDDLDLPHAAKTDRRIIEVNSYSWDVREAIRSIVAHPFEERAKAGRLLAELAEIDEMAVQLSELRNEFVRPQSGGIVGAFLRKFPDYYDNVLDFDERSRAAEKALLRAAEKFDPKIAEFSTFAYRCIRSEIRRTAEVVKEHTTISLDAPLRGKKGDDGGTRMDHIANTREAAPSHSVFYTALREELQAEIAGLEPLYQELVKLRFGFGADRREWTHKEAAEELNRQGHRTLQKGKKLTAEKIRQYERFVLRELAIRMTRRKKDLLGDRALE